MRTEKRDELTPPPQESPIDAHVRGLVAHVADRTALLEAVA